MFLVVYFPVTFLSELDFAAARDERISHYPLIREFSAEWPRISLSDYQVPTTPLYHVVLSTFARAFNDNLQVLRSINLLISIAALSLFYAVFRYRLSWKRALLATITIGLAPFFFGPATRLMTDNASLLMVMGSLYLLWTAPLSVRMLLLTGVLISTAVATRQTNIWLSVFAVTVFARHFNTAAISEKYAASALLLLPGFTLGGFFLLWSGLVPPSRQNYWAHDEFGWLNPNALSFAVSLAGAYGAFYARHYWQLYREQEGRLGHVLLLILVSWAFLLVCPYQPHQNVSPGPLDQIVRITPSVAGSPAILFFLFPLGLLVIYVAGLWARHLRDGFVLAAYVIWLGVGLGYPIFYQRHFEAFTLFFVLYYGLQGTPAGRWPWTGPVVLVASLFTIDMIHHLSMRIS